LNGIRIYDLHIAFRGATTDLDRVSLTWQTVNEAPASFFLTLHDGNVLLSVPKQGHPATRVPGGEVPPADWWNTFQSPVTLDIMATNIAFQADGAGLKHSLNGVFSINCRLSGTTLVNRVSGSCTGLLPSPAALLFSVTQYSNRFDVTCESTDILLARVADLYKPFLSVPISCSRGQADARLRSQVIFSAGPPILTNTRVTARINGLDAALPGFNLKARKSSGSLLLYTTQAVHLHTNHADLVKYLLDSLGGTGSIAIQSFVCRDITATNITMRARILSNDVYLVGSELYAFGGRVRSTGRLARKKVKGKEAWRFRYDLDMVMTNLDAGSICDTLNLYKNRLEGRFHGRISTYIFSRWVKKLNGTLDSDGKGIFYFPESEKYVKSMDAGMQKQMVTIMTERLKKYPYQVCHIDLDYDRLEKTTYITFGFYSDYDNSSYLFPVAIHMSWLDALKLMKQFQ
jgi:hypothetical protein